MPSTRKQKAEEKRSRQSDSRSDIENVDVTLGFFLTLNLMSKKKKVKLVLTKGQEECKEIQMRKRILDCC